MKAYILALLEGILIIDWTARRRGIKDEKSIDALLDAEQLEPFVRERGEQLLRMGVS